MTGREARPALFWKPEGDGPVRCLLCPHACLVPPGGRGTCGVRVNRDGRLFSLVNGWPAACQVDPVEKKPLYHYLPGSRCLSIGTAGCNFKCLFCQNDELSQAVKAGGEPAGFPLEPTRALDLAASLDCPSLAWTYSEPTVFYEYMLETARLGAERGIASIMVSNGYIRPEPLGRLAPLVSAANLDLKSFRDGFYRDTCGGRLKPVLETIVSLRRKGAWLELTTLVIPGLNDSDREIARIAAFIRRELGPGTPWHLSRFHPCHRMTDRPPTPVETIRRAVEIGRGEGLHHIYPGNLPGHRGADTDCPSCGRRLIERRAFRVDRVDLDGNRCLSCGHRLPGVFRPGRET